MCAFLIPALIGVGALAAVSNGGNDCDTGCYQQQCQPACAAPAPAYYGQQQYTGSYGYQQGGYQQGGYGQGGYGQGGYGYNQASYSSYGSGANVNVGGYNAGMNANIGGSGASVGMYGGR